MVRLPLATIGDRKPLSCRQRVAYAGNDAIPFTFVGCGVINQHAVYVATSKITAVVPNVPFAKAGHHEKKDAGHYEEIASNGNVNRKVAPPFTLLTPHNLPP